jgi:hypothetical protein
MKRFIMFATLIVASLGLLASFAGAAAANTTGPISFESTGTPAYAVGDINQNGWTKSGPYDVAVASVAGFPDASNYGFGEQALRLSNAVTSGSFGDQTFSPGVAPAGQSPALPHFDASFQIGTTQAGLQPGLAMSVSPDDGNGSRMSYLRFEDHTNGVHVYFDDVTDRGPLGTVAVFNETDIATLSRTSAHTIAFSITFKSGSATDLVKITIDGKKAASGTSWKNYYRFDPEQTGNGNKVPNVSKLLFREGGPAVSENSGKGFLVDGVTLASS